MRLSHYLASRILASGLIVLASVLVGGILHVHHGVAGEVRQAAATLQRLLELQVTGLRQGLGMQSRFPEWEPLTRVARPAGTCVRLFARDGTLLRSECRGAAPGTDTAPAWFAAAYRRAFEPGAIVRREFGSGVVGGLLEVVPDPGVEIALAWQRTSAVAMPAAGVILALGLIVGLGLRPAVRPVAEIMRGLARLGEGLPMAPLGPYRLREFDRIAVAVNELAASLTASERARLELAQRLNSVQEEERLQLACELHDEFGQHLSAIGANAAALRATHPDHAPEELARIEQSARHLRDLVRARLQTLRPWQAGDGDLADSLRALVFERVAAGGTAPAISLSIETDLTLLDPVAGGALYRVVQEALTNALRHADAQRIEVVARRETAGLVVTIGDDGRGCTATRLRSGLGIRGMRERIAACDGNLQVGPGPSGGLRVEAHLPWPDPLRA